MKKVLFIFFILLFKAYSQEYVYGNVLQLPSHMYAVVVSKSYQKMLVVQMEDGYPVVVNQFLAVTGVRFGDKEKQGDMRTPSGVYFPVEFKPDRLLPSYYGAGAYVLNYPNAFDRFVIKRDGDGIWIHGSKEEKPLFFSSKGCVILNNSSFKKLFSYIKVGKTPVIIQERFVKLSIDEFLALKKKINSFVDRYLQAVISVYKGDTTSLLDLYSQNFSSEEGTVYDIMKSYKKLFFSYGETPFVRDVNRMILYDRREEKEFFTVYLNLGFLSGDEIKTVKKVLYITVEDRKLKIVSEENF
ncbi:MAG: L,D-transpeptidase family protein [Persephonella sp.]|nr:L,D-transpeptidase family protein [Persephonella sp.]